MGLTGKHFQWLVLVYGIAFVHICDSKSSIIPDSHYDNNIVDSGTIQGNTSNNTCPPCKKGEIRLTDNTAALHPCLCSKCPKRMYPDIDDRCVLCGCCNKTNMATGENMWGNVIKECDAQFQYRKCDRDMDYRVEKCPAEPPYVPDHKTTHPVEFPWMYTVIIGGATVLIISGIMGTIFWYKRRKRSNEEELLHESVEEEGDVERGHSNEILQDAAGGFSERTQDVAGDADEGQTDISPSVNSEDNESAILSGALTCESEQAANSRCDDGPLARDSSIEDSMTDVSSKSMQDKGDDQVRVHENNVREDADAAAKADPWSEEDELLYEDQQQRSESVSSPPQQRPGGDSFISVNPSSDPNPEDEFVRIAQRHNETDSPPEDRAEYEENEETFYKCTEGGVIRQAMGDESSGSFFTIVKTGQQETGAVSPLAATHLDNPPAGDPNTVPIDDASNVRIWQEGGAETHAEVSAITAIDQQGLIQSQINEGDVRNDNYDETSCKAPVGDGAVQETGNESITKHGQQETGSVVKGGQQETASNPAQQSVESSPSQVVQEVDQYLLTRATEEETAEEFPGRETVEEFPETKPGLTPNPQPRVTTNSRSETTNQMSGQASGGTVRMQSLAGEEATQQTVTRDVSITKHGQQEAATVVKGGQQVTIVDNAQQSAESSPIQIVEAEEPVDSILSETDSATEQDLPDSGTGVDCGMAAAPRPADSKADEEELEPQNKETNLQASSQDEEGENDELNMVTPSSTGDQAQQEMGKEIVQNLPTTATAKEPVEGFPGAKQGLTIKPQPCITTDSRSETTNQMSGQASGGTVRVHHSDALSRPQVKANEHGSNYGDQVSDQDVANDQRPGEEEEAGDEDENAARCLEQVQDNDSVSTDG